MTGPFEREERTEEELAVGRAWLDQLGATLGVNRYPLSLYPDAGPGNCDDCKHEHDQRRQYHRVQLCDPCLRLRERTRQHLERRRERPPELTEETTG